MRRFFVLSRVGTQVTKDQQTWRKEFDANSAAPTPDPKAAPKPVVSKAGVREHAIAIAVYDARGGGSGFLAGCLLAKF